MLHIGRNILSLIISRLLAAVVLFLVYTRLLQYLGPNAAGQFGLLAAYLTVFNFFVDLGMQNLVIKKVSENKAEAGKYLANYFSIQFLMGVSFMLIMDALVLFGNYPPLVKHALYITALCLLLSSMTMPFMAIINAFQKFSIIAKLNFVNAMINASMMFLAVFLHKSIFFLAFIPGMIAAVNIIVYAIYVHKKFTPFYIGLDKKFWKYLFILNLPFMLLTLFSIYNRIDSLILPHLRSFTENGYYTAVYKFWDTLAFVPAVVAASLYPYFADKIAKNEMSDVRHVLQTYTRFMIALAIPMATGAFLLSRQITVEFFGQAFAPAAPALGILVSAVGVLFIYVPVNTVIVSQRTKTATIITGFNLLFNLTANLILIPKFGFIVAAIVTLASELVQLIGYTIVVKRQIIDFEYFVNFAKPALASLIMGAAIYYLRDHNLWLVVGLGGLVYVGVLLGLQFFHRSDWELLKTSINFRKKVEVE